MTPSVLSETEVAADLEAFLCAQFPATTAGGVRHDVDLFEDGIVDSVGVAETLSHIEERYEIEIPDEVLLSDDFTTIDGIARSIVRLVADNATTP